MKRKGSEQVESVRSPKKIKAEIDLFNVPQSILIQILLLLNPVEIIRMRSCSTYLKNFVDSLKWNGEFYLRYPFEYKGAVNQRKYGISKVLSDEWNYRTYSKNVDILHFDVEGPSFIFGWTINDEFEFNERTCICHLDAVYARKPEFEVKADNHEEEEEVTVIQTNKFKEVDLVENEIYTLMAPSKNTPDKWLFCPPYNFAPDLLLREDQVTPQMLEKDLCVWIVLEKSKHTLEKESIIKNTKYSDLIATLWKDKPSLQVRVDAFDGNGYEYHRFGYLWLYYMNVNNPDIIMVSSLEEEEDRTLHWKWIDVYLHMLLQIDDSKRDGSDLYGYALERDVDLDTIKEDIFICYDNDITYSLSVIYSMYEEHKKINCIQ